MTSARFPNFRREALLSTLGGVIRIVLNLVAIPILLKSLGIERYGTFAILQAVISIAVALRPGWNEGLTHFLASSRAIGDPIRSGRLIATSLVLTCAWGALLSCALFILSQAIVTGLFPRDIWANQQASTALLKLLAVVVLARLIQLWAVAVEAGLMRFDVSAALESGLGMLLNLGLIVLASAKLGLPAIIAWTVIIALLGATVHVAVVCRLVGVRYTEIVLNWMAARDLSSYGMVSAISNIGSVLFAQGDRVLVGALLGPFDAGLYSTVASVAAKINEVSAMPLQALPPAISDAVAKGDRERIAKLYSRTFHLNGLLVCFLTTALMALAWPIGLVLIGSEAAQLFANTLIVMSLFYGLYCLNGPAYYVCLGSNQVGINAVAVILGGSFTLLLISQLAPIWGVLGVALGNVGFQLTWLITIVVTRNLSTISRYVIRDLIVFMLSLTILAVSSATIIQLSDSYWLSSGVVIILAGAISITMFLSDLRYGHWLVKGMWQRIIQKFSVISLY